MLVGGNGKRGNVQFTGLTNSESSLTKLQISEGNDHKIWFVID